MRVCLCACRVRLRAVGSQALAPCGLQLRLDLAQCPPGVRQCLWAPLWAARASEETRGGCRPEGLGPGLRCSCEALPRVTPESQSYPYKWRPSPLGRAWASETAHVLCQWRGAALGPQARTTMPHSSPSLHCQWSSNERGQELICKCYK